MEEVASSSEVCDTSAEMRTHVPRRDRDMRAELQAWKEAKAARAAQQKAEKAAKLPDFQVPRRLRPPTPPPSLHTSSGSENVPFGDTASAAVKAIKVAAPAPQQGCSLVSPRSGSPTQVQKAIRPLGERSQNTLGPSSPTAASGLRSVSPSLRYTQCRMSPRSQSRPTTPPRKASESAFSPKPASAGTLARAALCISQQAVLRPSAKQAREASAASHASEEAFAALPESCPEAAAPCRAIVDEAAAAQAEEELDVTQVGEPAADGTLCRYPDGFMGSEEEPLDATCISIPSSSSSASSSPRSAGQSSAPEAEFMDESASLRPGLSLAMPPEVADHPPAPCVPLCWQPPAPPGPPPNMPLFDKSPESEDVLEARAPPELPSEESSACVPESRATRGFLLQVAKPPAEPVLATPDRGQRQHHAGGEKAFAATTSVECIALYEERAAMPTTPPPTPATPSAALAAAKSMMCQLVDADAEFAHAAQAAVAHLANIEESSSPSLARAPLEGQPEIRDAPGESCLERPSALSPEAPLSPLSLESPQTDKMHPTP